jgi:hypothetical protein
MNKIIAVIKQAKLDYQLKGGSGSGNFGHSGRPGAIGGSVGGGGMGGGSALAFEPAQPASLHEHSAGAYMRNSYAKELSKELGGKSSPSSAGSHQSDHKSASFSTKKPQAEVAAALTDKGFVQQGSSYYNLDTKYGRGVKADLSITPHKPSFYAEPEDWTTVEFTSVIRK